MKKGKYVVWFDQIDKDDIPLVGGKGANLGEMLKADFPVPYGFVITAKAYFYVIEHNNLHDEIRNFVDVINFENSRELQDAAEAIRSLIVNAEVPKDLIYEIHDFYNHLLREESKHFKKSKSEQIMKHLRSAYSEPLVAVRSSATAEDLPDASFAGQQETYLNIKGENNLLEKVKHSWASLFTDRAMYYRQQQHFDHLKVGLASVVQRMVQSTQSGIAFSLDPITNNQNVITIEAIHGLGEYIVGGIVTPDHYEIAKGTYEILKKEIKEQKVQLIKKGVENEEVKLTPAHASTQKISDDMIVTIAKVVEAIEKHYGRPQDIEWAAEHDSLFIVQSRPVTTMKKAHQETPEDSQQTSTLKVVLKGSPASPGIGSGKPVIITTPREIDKITEGKRTANSLRPKTAIEGIIKYVCRGAL